MVISCKIDQLCLLAATVVLVTVEPVREGREEPFLGSGKVNSFIKV